MPSSNPSGCCGAPTSCCPNLGLPDHLSITITTDCGANAGILGRSSDYSPPYPTWKGKVSILCKPDPPYDCTACTVEVVLFCIPPFYFTIDGTIATNLMVTCVDLQQFKVAGQFQLNRFCYAPLIAEVTK
jgi:hypothetical protein